MAKHLVFLIFMLTVLAFTACCSPKENEASEPPEAKERNAAPTKVERPNNESNVFEVPKTEIHNVEAPEAEPNEPETAKIERNNIEAGNTEPNELQASKAEPNVIEPAKTEPNKVEPNEVKQTPKVAFHDKCADILKTYVDDKGMVDYKTLKRKRLELKDLLREFTKLNPKEYQSWPKEDKIAFWINTYNFQTLKIIIDNYPIESSWYLRLLPGWEPDSIRHIERNIGSINEQKFYVMGEEFKLWRIEERFFRKEFDEPRVFFGICYATLSSPPLRNEPYRGATLSEQLDDQVKKFLSNPRAFKIDRNRQIVYLSFIFEPKWFGSEFVAKYGTNKRFKDERPAVRAVLNFITNYISDLDINFLKMENYSVEFMRHDMRLNDSS